MVKGVVDRFSEEFVETRRKALDKFLKRITDHPVLSFNEHFNVFLTAKVRAGFSYSLPQTGILRALRSVSSPSLTSHLREWPLWWPLYSGCCVFDALWL